MNSGQKKLFDRVDRIEELALKLNPNPDMSDMIYDIVLTEPDLPDNAIAHRVAMSYAFP